MGGSRSPYVPWASSDAARRTMQGNRRRDTSIEMAVRRLLFAQGLRYRVDWPLPSNRRRRADIVFTRQKIAVFIDGCFWHGCPEHFMEPQTNSTYWRAKIAGNALRDMATNEELEANGWTTIRRWEHEDPSSIAMDILRAVKQASSASLEAEAC